MKPKVVRWLLILALVVLGYLGWEIYRASVPQKLRRSAETTVYTEPVRRDGFVDYVAILDEIYSRGVTVENNAAVVMAEIWGPKLAGGQDQIEFFGKMGIQVPPSDGQYFVPFFQLTASPSSGSPMSAGTFANDDSISDPQTQFDEALTRRWQPDRLPMVMKWLESNQYSLELLTKMTQRDRFYFPYHLGDASAGAIGIILEPIQQLRTLARLLIVRSHLALEQGDLQQVADDVIRIRKLAMFADQGLSLLDQLVGIALSSMAFQLESKLIQEANWTKQQALDRIQQLRQMRLGRSMARRIDTAERMMFLDSLRLVQNEGIEMATGTLPPHSQLLNTLIRFADLNTMASRGNEFYDDLVARASISDVKQRNQAMDKFEEDMMSLERATVRFDSLALGSLSGRRGRGKLVSTILLLAFSPAIPQIDQAESRAQAQQDLIEIAWSLYAYHQDHGEYPETTGELVGNYLGQVPMDPFTGDPLVYRREKQGLVLYSVGRNRQDDGGQDLFDENNPGDEPMITMGLKDESAAK